MAPKKYKGVKARTMATGNTLYYAMVGNAVFGSFPTPAKAFAFYCKAKEEQRQGRFYPDQYRRQRQLATIETAMDKAKPFASRLKNYRGQEAYRTFWKGVLGRRPLRSITGKDIRWAQAQLLKQGKQPATVNRYTEYLKHLLNGEVMEGTILRNPVVEVKKLVEPEAPIYQYSQEEEARLIAELGASADYVRLAILTGMRQAEQFSLKKEWVRWDAGTIVVPTSKANRPRVFFLTEEVKWILYRLCEVAPEHPYVFPSPRFPNRPMSATYFYRKIFVPACTRARVPITHKWHTLRHTTGSRLAALGASNKQIQELLGHSTDRAARRYIHFYKEDLKTLAAGLSRTGTGTKPEPTSHEE